MTDLNLFKNKVENKTAVIGIVGLGYVGLPLAIEFVKAEFNVIGFDIDQEKNDQLNAKKSYINHIPSSAIAMMVDNNKFNATSDFSKISECDAILMCVPTPLNEHREPDMKYIINTAELLAPYVKENQLYCLESTTYPGTTREVLVPILESKNNLKATRDFFVGYSPEREDPNNGKFSTATIPKVVGGLDKDSLAAGVALYNQIIVETVPVSSVDAAEATKLMENIFRCVNIALVNELKVVFEKMNIDVWEVINAAKTKPFGFMPFYPGPGLGGHCIPIDPFYLTWKAREFDCATRFIELAGEINSKMPYYVIDRCMNELNEQGKSLKNSKILILGLAYKKNVDDPRESPSFKLWKLLEEKGAVVSYHDPYCPTVPKMRAYPELYQIPSTPIEKVSDFDLVLLSTDHDNVDYDFVQQNAKLIIDTRNAFKAADNTFKA
ncbi:nucleotide sugar dehydrogenase [Lentisphaerota bacterium WC36G]|nr:nucleotide sugar dehydrogenase [Lentisphaerae bacterium WC36]